MKSETKTCQNCKQDFEITENDFSFYERMKVPPPTFCPDCRFKIRAMWRNEMTLYSRKCDKTGEAIISMFNPKLDYIVVSHNYYKSDKWDSLDYGQDYDSSKSFFGQLDNLFKKVPKRTTYLDNTIGENINSDYSNYVGGVKNCYLIFNTGTAEESLYSRGLRYSKEVVDCYYGSNSELMYECVNFSKSSKIFYGKDINDCVDCAFIENCNGCINCFGCVNLRNKSNYIFNKKVSKKEYNKFINEILGSYKNTEKFKKDFNFFRKKFPIRSNHNLKSINSTGDYLFECKNVKNSFEITKSEDSNYLFAGMEVKDSIGIIGHGTKSERLLECVSVGYSSNIIGCCNISGSHNIMYSIYLKNCHDCIGCDSLKNAEYCILNKQYTKEKYEVIKNYIIKELVDKGIHGLMISPSIAPFAYNETIAQDNLPLTKEKALAQGFRWEDDIQTTKDKETFLSKDIPDDIKDVSNDITKEILKCISCERNYKIIEQELLFYRKMKLPIPRKCFFCRHKDRIKKRGPYKLWNRKCNHCGKDIETNYSPDRSEIIYCEKCYQQEVY